MKTKNIAIVKPQYNPNGMLESSIVTDACFNISHKLKKKEGKLSFYSAENLTQVGSSSTTGCSHILYTPIKYFKEYDGDLNINGRAVSLVVKNPDSGLFNLKVYLDLYNYSPKENYLIGYELWESNFVEIPKSAIPLEHLDKIINESEAPKMMLKTRD